MKHSLTLIPILAILATCAGSQPSTENGYLLAVSQNVTVEEASLLDSGVHQIYVGDDALNFTPLVSSDSVETRKGPHQHHRMTFDTSNLPLCSDRPGWNEPAPDDWVSPGTQGTPPCLFHVLVLIQKDGKTVAHEDIAENLEHGKNSIEFNYKSNHDFKVAFGMAGGITTVFNAATGEVTKTMKSYEEQERERQQEEELKREDVTA